MIVRRWLVALSLSTSACSYPEFSFRAGEDASEDTTTEDTAREETAVEEDTAIEDSATEDTSLVDTSVMDAAKDSAVDAKDSATADTADSKVDPCTGHLFCSTFDGTSVTAGGWTGNYVTGGGLTTLDTTLSVTAPKSLHASLPTGAVTAAASLSLAVTSPAITTKFRVECDVRLDALTYPATGTSVVVLKVQRDSTGDGIALVVQDTGLAVEANGAVYSSYPVTKTIAAKTWFHVKLEGTLQTVGGSVALYIDDMKTPVVSQSGISTAEADDTQRQPLVGLFSYMKSSAFEAHFDDYTFDFLP